MSVSPHCGVRVHIPVIIESADRRAPRLYIVYPTQQMDKRLLLISACSGSTTMKYYSSPLLIALATPARAQYPECIYGKYRNQSCYVHECEACNPESVEGCILQEGWCKIRDSCYADGHAFTTHAGLSNCQVCDTERSTSDWSWAYTGNWCSDTVFCNGEDSCVYIEETKTSSCSAHTGDPCAQNTDMCNNTCVEPTTDEPGNCYTGEVTCASSTVCADYKCSKGSCQMFAYGSDVACGEEAICANAVCGVEGVCENVPKADYTACGAEDLCTASVCLQGTCAIGHPKTDGTACGEILECVEHVCASGQCAERPPDPVPHCDVCPCGDNYECSTNSGLCVAEEGEDGESQVALIVGVSVGSVVMCAAVAFAAFSVVMKSQNPVLRYALLDAELEDPNGERNRPSSDVETVHPVAVPPGHPYLTRAKAAPLQTKYIREDESMGAVIINKKL